MLALTLDLARHTIARSLLGDGARGDERVGIESEVFVVCGPEPGSPRIALQGPGGSVELVAATGVGRYRQSGGNPAFDLGALGTITFEPGAQIEHATRPRSSAAAAIDDVAAFRALLGETAAARERRIVATGLDLMHSADDIPQYLPGPRYRAMADYFKTKGPFGSEMMRNSASIQINLDGGPDVVRRWRIANLISPLLTATFSTSSTPEHASRRAHVWQELDRSRTGFPDLTAPSFDALVEWLLDAHVMFRWIDETTTSPVPPEISFRDWIDRRPPELPPATQHDLAYHLTTVFPEVRVRHGVLELRATDTLPDDHVAVPAVLVDAAIYDAEAARAIEDLLDPTAGFIDDRWRTAATSGLADDALHRDCLAVWDIALAAARRNPDRYGWDHIDRTEAFLSDHTRRRQSPSSMPTYRPGGGSTAIEPAADAAGRAAPAQHPGNPARASKVAAAPEPTAL